MDSKVAPPNESFPEMYQPILAIAQERHALEIVPLEELQGGRTGAVLYLVSVVLAGSAQVEHFILKLDHGHKKARSDEITRHRLAWNESPPDFASHHMANLALEVKDGDQIALFYTIAGQSLHHFRPLANYENRTQLETLFIATNDYLLGEWNKKATFRQAVHPQRLLEHWLGYRLTPAGGIGEFLESVCQVSQDTAGLFFQGQVYPNPLAFCNDRALWGHARSIDALIGFQHGDLNIGNILAKFKSNSSDLAGYYLIDFALYKSQMPLLFDKCYLEMSYLIQELERTKFDKWLGFVRQLAEPIRPNPNQVPVELAGSCAVINAGRAAFEDWVVRSHASLSDDLWSQLWLAAVAAGLNYCNKRVLADHERLAGLLFAAAHLKQYCAQFRVPEPSEIQTIAAQAYLKEASPIGIMEQVPSDPLAAKIPPYPTGNVTFLFTDMVGSTALWEAFPEKMPAVMETLDALFNQIASEYQGVIFKSLGDGFCIAFPTAYQGIQAAVAGQQALLSRRWGPVGSIQLRMACHTGEANLVKGDYFGPSVNRTARMLASAFGGQIISSKEVRQALEDETPAEISWKYLGRYWLKGLKEPVEIIQVVAPGLPSDFPPAPAVELRTSQLPVQATPFVGREQELAELATLLTEHRLVTLYGPGGIGKTRLALALAEKQTAYFRDGVYFVPLLPLKSFTAITPTIANALGLTFLEGRPPEEQLLDHLRPCHLLLLMDNMEHLLQSDIQGPEDGKTLALIEAMLATASEVKILITSRELLRLPQEKAYQIRGLPRGYQTITTLTAHDDAFELFQLRAQQSRPTLDLKTAENGDLARKICNLVEGMPLAIELAAAQLRLLSLADIVAEINHGLDILDSGLRGSGARHSSVRVVFENSWQQLDENEKRILACLSVFRGGFSQQAAAVVCRARVTDLAQLHDKSLIQISGEERFVLHALIQKFASEKLSQMQAEELDARQRHFRYFQELLAAANDRWRDNHDSLAFDDLLPEAGNLRTGWDWALGQGYWNITAEYLDDLWQYFKVGGRLTEAIELLEQAIEAGSESEPLADSVYLAHWERLLGQAHLWMSQLKEGDQHFQQTLALLGWPRPASKTGLLGGSLKELVSQGLHRLWPGYFVGRAADKQVALGEAFIAYERMTERAAIDSDTLTAVYCGLRSLNLAEASGVNSLIARAYAGTGMSFALMSAYGIAGAYLKWSTALVLEEDSPEVQEWVSRLSGYYYTNLGDWQAAKKCFERSNEAAGQLGRHWEQENGWIGLMMVAYQEGDFDRCLEYVRRIDLSSSLRGDVGFEIAVLYWRAFFKLRQGGDPAEAVKLLEKPAIAPAGVMNVMDWIIVFSTLAQAYLRLSQDELAALEALKAIDLMRAISRPSNPIAYYGYADTANAFLTLWERNLGDDQTSKIRALARQSCKELSRYAKIVPISQPLIDRCQGLFWWLDGRPKKAWAAWQKSLTRAEGFGIPYEAGLAHAEIGRHLVQGKESYFGLSREDHLQQAAAIFERIGAMYDLYRVKELLES